MSRWVNRRMLGMAIAIALAVGTTTAAAATAGTFSAVRDACGLAKPDVDRCFAQIRGGVHGVISVACRPCRKLLAQADPPGGAEESAARG